MLAKTVHTIFDVPQTSVPFGHLGATRRQGEPRQRTVELYASALVETSGLIVDLNFVVAETRTVFGTNVVGQKVGLAYVVDDERVGQNVRLELLGRRQREYGVLSLSYRLSGAQLGRTLTALRRVLQVHDVAAEFGQLLQLVESVVVVGAVIAHSAHEQLGIGDLFGVDEQARVCTTELVENKVRVNYLLGKERNQPNGWYSVVGRAVRRLEFVQVDVHSAGCACVHKSEPRGGIVAGQLNLHVVYVPVVVYD
ncbi:hypothetical protein BpHYR1_039696 [Brachionus plicatilis]|uniref:Uncharacterized protein n=1 Tax=Brachionus plicatilis TaxID=10195 RepID=A0A3M7QDN6_BRAPC|nr:hypothetical protein BpHYR1_039696 [Brachionus plicatilis]